MLKKLTTKQPSSDFREKVLNHVHGAVAQRQMQPDSTLEVEWLIMSLCGG